MLKQPLFLCLSLTFALASVVASGDVPPDGANVQVNGAKAFPKEDIQKILDTGSGISGPGKPWMDDGKLHGTAELSGILPPIKPIYDIHMRDTSIILGGGRNYYLTGSTGDNIWNYNDGIELWRSPDLQRWTYLGLVWAPEIRYIHHNYYITFGMPPGGMAILKSATGRPEGPYVHATDPNRPLLGGIGPTSVSFLIDPTLFEDDDGKVYFTYGPGNEIARMKDDLSGFAEPLRKVVLADRGPYDPARQRDKDNPFGFEGATIFKANGRYYFGSTDRYEGRYSMCVGISDNIYGPYHMRHETVPCNGGTGFFKAKDGHWYTGVMGGDAASDPWNERPGIVRVDFAADGRVVPAKAQPDFILIKQRKSATP